MLSQKLEEFVHVVAFNGKIVCEQFSQRKQSSVSERVSLWSARLCAAFHQRPTREGRKAKDFRKLAQPVSRTEKERDTKERETKGQVV